MSLKEVLNANRMMMKSKSATDTAGVIEVKVTQRMNGRWVSFAEHTHTHNEIKTRYFYKGLLARKDVDGQINCCGEIYPDLKAWKDDVDKAWYSWATFAHGHGE